MSSLSHVSISPEYNVCVTMATAYEENQNLVYSLKLEPLFLLRNHFAEDINMVFTSPQDLFHKVRKNEKERERERERMRERERKREREETDNY